MSEGAKLVLVVDDDPAIREALRQALEDEGHSVSEACDGAAALSTLRAGMRPHVILLDHMMPVMDGPTFAAEVGKDPALSGLSIVLITADGRAPQKAQAMGLSAYLNKPVELDVLLDLVART